MAARRDDAVARLTEGLRARLRADRVAEGLLAGTAVCLGGLTLGLLAIAESKLGVLAVALLLGVATMSWLPHRRRGSWSPTAVVREAEARIPALRNHLVTALELDAHPDRATPAVRDHVTRYLTRVVGDLSIDDIHSRRRSNGYLAAAGMAAILTIVAWLVLATPAVRQTIGAAIGTRGQSPSDGGIARVRLAIAAPAYVGGALQTLIDPARIEALSGSLASVEVESHATAITVYFNDRRLAVGRAGSVFHARVDLATSGFLLIESRDDQRRVHDRRLVPVVVKPDAPPQVTIDQPQKDLFIEHATGQIRVVAHARDDLALETLTLHFTKVTGSGENYGFVEGELPLALERTTPADWRGAIRQPLAALGLQEGDLLVYFARATDRRPGAEPAVSDSYVIEIGRLRAAVAGGFALPPEKDKAAISLSALIVKTERLHGLRDRLESRELTERAAGLAVEQRMVRTETLFLMGAHGEVVDEEAEAEHSNEIQEGRLENRGQADLRVATRLMSTAERNLLIADTGAALQAQRAALAAMQRALSKQRYLLRTIPVRSQIDPTRRLSGDLATARSWDRRDAAPRPNQRLASVRQLLLDLSKLATIDRASSATGRRPLPAEAGDLPRRVLAVDPASAALQEAARDLTRLIESNASLNDADRRALLSRVVQSLQQQVVSSPATAGPPDDFSSSPLRGAFTDALRARGTRP